MKYELVLPALLLILASTLISGLVNYVSSPTANALGGSSSSSSNVPRICVLSNCNYFGTANVCGRFGSSNLCKRFSNSCLLRYEACVSRVTYSSVALTMCSNIAVGSRGQCSGSSSSSSSSIFGTGSTSNSNVQAIVVRRRRRG